MIVMVIWSFTARQLPLPVEVNVKVTVPAVMSAALKVYVPVRVVLFGLKVPIPLLLH